MSNQSKNKLKLQTTIPEISPKQITKKGNSKHPPNYIKMIHRIVEWIKTCEWITTHYNIDGLYRCNEYGSMVYKERIEYHKKFPWF